MLIDYLIVDEHYRKKGHGETLLVEAEALARQEGCQFMALSTFDFQGPHYYPKFSFKEVYVRRHFPQTGSEHFKKNYKKTRVAILSLLVFLYLL